MLPDDGRKVGVLFIIPAFRFGVTVRARVEVEFGVRVGVRHRHQACPQECEDLVCRVRVRVKG